MSTQERQPHIIKVDCDKWSDRFFCGLIVAGIIGWAAATIFLIYAEIYVIQNHTTVYQLEDWFIFLLTMTILTGLNIINLYHVTKVTYDVQNIFKFECVSKESS